MQSTGGPDEGRSLFQERSQDWVDAGERRMATARQPLLSPALVNMSSPLLSSPPLPRVPSPRPRQVPPCAAFPPFLSTILNPAWALAVFRHPSALR